MISARTITSTFAIASALMIAASASADDATPPASQYDFLLGDWDLEAASVQPDQSLMPGTGVMNVYEIHDGHTLQADMRVVFENGMGFIGSTMRTYDNANQNWAVSWVQAGTQTFAGGTAVWDDDRMVETWPVRQDGFGTYQDTLVLYDITEDRFVVSMDRQYVEGPLIEGVWRYVATRQEADSSD